MQASFGIHVTVKRLLLSLLLVYGYVHVQGQKKWDGEAGDGLWNTALNWLDDIVPSASDDVLLDQSVFTGNYSVTLPSGTVGIVIRSLIIIPSVPHTIEVVLPASNTAIPGFTTAGTEYGLVIHKGGIFRNSSGAPNGTPVNISDSIKINNGGLYVHNTGRAHAGNVTVLSTALGTEQGSFEFDVPGGSGYTVSIAGRTYGNMVLSATAAGGAKSYTSTGTTTVNINGQFRINPGVNYSLNFNGGFIVHGDFFHHGNTFDISSGLHSNRVNIRSNMDQTGLITESGSGLPVLEFAGSSDQHIAAAGGITGSNTLRVNNRAGITLQTPMSILYKLELVNGKLRTTSANILVMHDNAICAGGSYNSFVEGPIRKIGDEDFEYPIGRQADYAPLFVSGGGATTDQFEAEYFLGDPMSSFGTPFEYPPIVRVSRLEYWNVNRTTGTSSKKITVSVRTYSNATLLEKLVVSRWDPQGNIWKNEGNSAYTGISSGTVTSNTIQLFGIFTIGSTVIDQNPLPLFPVDFKAEKQDKRVLISWKTKSSADPASFEILKSENSRDFQVLKKMDAIPNQSDYGFVEKIQTEGSYHYRLKMVEKSGSTWLSKIVMLTHEQSRRPLLAIFPAITSSNAHLTITASEKQTIQLFVLDLMGRSVRQRSLVVYRGSSKMVLDISGIPAGVYYVSGMANGIRTNVIAVVKR